MTISNETKLSENSLSTLLSTARHCRVAVTNNWDGNGITNVTLRHRYRNHDDPESQQIRTWSHLSFGETCTPPLDVIYFTGFGTGFDYWWIEFTDSSGTVWTCKDNFYCYLEDRDSGITVHCILNGSNKEMQLTMNSSGCSVSVYQQT